MHTFALDAFNGLSYGLLLFMLSAGLTLIFSVQGVLNFAHASFYMLGAYVGYGIAARAGFWCALVFAPLAVGLIGAGCERWLLRRVQARGHTSELLLTFGLAYLIGEGAKLVWGLAPLPAPVPCVVRRARRSSAFDVALPRYPAVHDDDVRDDADRARRAAARVARRTRRARGAHASRGGRGARLRRAARDDRPVRRGHRARRAGRRDRCAARGDRAGARRDGRLGGVRGRRDRRARFARRRVRRVARGRLRADLRRVERHVAARARAVGRRRAARRRRRDIDCAARAAGAVPAAGRGTGRTSARPVRRACRCV
ncbi:inner-membrane translocator, partial [Burkholderia dolosa AU0158]